MFQKAKVNRRRGLYWPNRKWKPSRNWKAAHDTRDGIIYDTNAKFTIRFRSREIGLAQKQSDKINHLAFGAINTNSSATNYHKKDTVYDVDPTTLDDAYMDLRIIRDGRTGNVSLRPRLLIDCVDGIHQVYFDWNSHKAITINISHVQPC